MDLALSTAADLRDTRRSSGLSQTQLSRLTGLAQPRISAYERGHIEPSLDTLARIAGAINRHVLTVRQHPAAEHVKRRAEMSDALAAFLAARPEYADLVAPLSELLASASSK